MNAIFIVEAGVHYQGSRLLRAFGSRPEAETFAERCREYHKTRPDWPGGDATEADLEAWRVADNAWEAGHPGGDVGSPDYFDVTEVPFGPVAASGESGVRDADA
jgi:hypothetical protein